MSNDRKKMLWLKLLFNGLERGRGYDVASREASEMLAKVEKDLAALGESQRTNPRDNPEFWIPKREVLSRMGEIAAEVEDQQDAFASGVRHAMNELRGTLS